MGNLKESVIISKLLAPSTGQRADPKEATAGFANTKTFGQAAALSSPSDNAPGACFWGAWGVLRVTGTPPGPARPSPAPPLPLRLVPLVDAVLPQPLPHLGQVAAGGRAVQLAQLLLAELVGTAGTGRGGGGVAATGRRRLPLLLPPEAENLLHAEARRGCLRDRQPAPLPPAPVPAPLAALPPGAGRLPACAAPPGAASIF